MLVPETGELVAAPRQSRQRFLPLLRQLRTGAPPTGARATRRGR
ncbi:MAG: hypothetical protein U0587_05475 [Candidatus Binatia bacterium]